MVLEDTYGHCKPYIAKTRELIKFSTLRITHTIEN